MTPQEKQETLSKLQTVIPLFQEFEAAYDMVVNLPQQKKRTRGKFDPPEVLKGAASTGTSILTTVVSFIVLLIPSFIAAAVLGGILFLALKLQQVNTGLIVLAALVIDIIASKRLGSFITEKAKAGGNKIQDAVNRQIRESNQAANAHNIEIDRLTAIADQRCEAVRQQISQLDMSWYPPDYYCSDAAIFFYKAVNNGMCESLGEAARLYEEKLFRNQVLANQQQQIDLAYRQCILQAMTISAIQREGEATREAIHSEGDAMRNTIRGEGNAMRGAIHAEGAAARQQARQQYDDFKHRAGL